MVKERTKRPAQTFERSFFRVLAHSAQIFYLIIRMKSVAHVWHNTRIV